MVFHPDYSGQEVKPCHSAVLAPLRFQSSLGNVQPGLNTPDEGNPPGLVCLWGLRVCKVLAVGTDASAFWNILLLLLPLPFPDSNLLHSPKNLFSSFSVPLVIKPDKQQILGTQGKSGNGGRKYSKERGFDWLALSHSVVITGRWQQCGLQRIAALGLPLVAMWLWEISNCWASVCSWQVILFFKKRSIYLFLERREGREKERERNIDVREKHWSVASRLRTRPDNPGMCSDGESNRWPLTLWNDTQPTEPHWSGLFSKVKVNIIIPTLCLWAGILPSLRARVWPPLPASLSFLNYTLDFSISRLWLPEEYRPCSMMDF